MSPFAAKHFNLAKMLVLFQITSRVETATMAYISIQDFVDRWEWEEKFEGEMVSAHILIYMAFRSLYI
jgi:hypothetical protein